MKSCLIFGGAPIGSLSLAPSGETFIIAADRGYLAAKQLGFTPDLAMGDFDSLDFIPEDCKVIKAKPEKDDTDTMLAVKTALEMGHTDISIAGALGGRLDHTYASIQTLAYILKSGGFGRLIGESDTAELLNRGEYSYDRREDIYLSLFSYGESAVITTRGTKYDLTEYTLSNSFPLGVSNEIIADKCSVSVHEGQLLVIFSKK